MNKSRTFILFSLIIYPCLSTAGDKETIFELLLNDIPTLNTMSKKCIDAFKSENKHNAYVTKTCSSAAVVASGFSARLSSFGAISERETNDMIDNYIDKHGKTELQYAQVKINDAAKNSQNVMKIFWIIVSN